MFFYKYVIKIRIYCFRKEVQDWSGYIYYVGFWLFMWVIELEEV